MINVLVENDYDTAEIKEAFRREPAVIEALREYSSQYDEEEEYEEYEEDEDTEDDEW